jgi:hypothetical protein
VDTDAVRTRAADGWRALRAFFAGAPGGLPEAVSAFEDAERLLRRVAGGGAAGDAEGILIGLSLALRLRRRPEDARRAVVLAQELLNTVRRTSGDEATLGLRAYLEDAYRDLARTLDGDAAAHAAEEGIEACDRTLALARRYHTEGPAAHARAVKSLLLRTVAAAAAHPSAAGGGRERRGDVRALLRESDRLAAAALAAWPATDAAGLAAFQADLADAIVQGAPPRVAVLDRAGTLVRRAGAAVPPDNRYLAALVARARARVALAGNRPDALDALAAAAAAFRELGLDREAREVEGWL